MLRTPAVMGTTHSWVFIELMKHKGKEQSWQEGRNKCTFDHCLNVSRDSEKVMSEGKQFHARASVTQKVWRPTAESLMVGKQAISGRGPLSLSRLDVLTLNPYLTRGATLTFRQSRHAYGFVRRVKQNVCLIFPNKPVFVRLKHLQMLINYFKYTSSREIDARNKWQCVITQRQYQSIPFKTTKSILW